jgi:hypothetical protein
MREKSKINIIESYEVVTKDIITNVTFNKNMKEWIEELLVKAKLYIEDDLFLKFLTTKFLLNFKLGYIFDNNLFILCVTKTDDLEEYTVVINKTSSINILFYHTTFDLFKDRETKERGYFNSLRIDFIDTFELLNFSMTETCGRFVAKKR